MIARTLYDRLWESHTVHVEEDGTTLLYIDRHLVHEVTSPQAFDGMKLARRKPWRVSANLAVADHNVPTTDRSAGIADPISRLQVDTLDKNCAEYGIVEFKMNDARQGIVHVIGPEQGATLPGMTVVCGDSHTSTHGAFACLAFGIGTSEVEHVLSTQCLLAKKMKNMLVRIEGPLARSRPCSRNACAISCPMTAASSSSVGFSLVRSPVYTAILPPGMHHAFTSGEVITFTCQFQRGASARNAAVLGIRRLATPRTRST